MQKVLVAIGAPKNSVGTYYGFGSKDTNTNGNTNNQNTNNQNKTQTQLKADRGSSICPAVLVNEGCPFVALTRISQPAPGLSTISTKLSPAIATYRKHNKQIQ